MKRYAYQQLVRWKSLSDQERKPLIVQGARQVGKTWLVEEFGRNEFDSLAEINFEEHPQLARLFEADFDAERILRAVQLATGVELVPGKTLIFFDEIQEAQRGVLALKYLLKHAPQYHIVAAGSLLGVALHPGDSFPVGKVDFLDVYPLSYEEFLEAMGQEKMVEALHGGDWALVTAFKSKYVDFLRQYYFVGGMPAVVAEYARSRNPDKARRLQRALLLSYERDFSKHPPTEIVPRIELVWNKIASQLAKENKKFVYSAVKQGGRAKDFELAIEWLQNAGAVYKITRIRQAALPIRGFEDFQAFKLYVVDVGLLGAMAGLDARTLMDGDAVFGQYKGALSEQYVLQQLKCIEDMPIHYWSPDTGVAEVDFVVQYKGEVIPIEVKAEENLKSKSLKSYRDKYAPALAVRVSMSDYREQDTLTNLPLYAVSMLPSLLR